MRIYLRGGNMYGKESSQLPIRFVMSISKNASALSTFLQMSNKEQDEIIKKARKINNQRKMEQFVSTLPQMK
jgi:hypothetical protein